MRVIAGIRKGTRLLSFKNRQIQPTKDIVKESMFNSISNYIDVAGISVCDLFAGTGALGIECLSRGARSVTFVESQDDGIELVQQNLKRTTLEQGATVVKSDAFEFLGSGTTGRFDLIFLDPPYGDNVSDELCFAVISQDRLVPGGLLVVETSSKQMSTENRTLELELLKQKKWGDSMIRIYRRHA